MPSFLIPGLMPGHKRRSFPAPVVVVGQHRIPVQEVGDSLMIPPPAPLLGQINGEVDHRNGSSSWRHFLGEWHDQDRTVPGVEVESGGSVSQENVNDLHALADRIHRLLGAKAKYLHRLGQLGAILVRHLVAGIDVETSSLTDTFDRLVKTTRSRALTLRPA